MPIKASTSRAVDALIADLTSGRAIDRDAAVARLAVLGSRAIDRLTALLTSTADPASRVAAVRSLEGMDDPRALGPVLAATDDRDTEVVAAALAACRSHLSGPRGSEALDRLSACALDRTRPRAQRIAALHALSGLPASTVRPLWNALAVDPDPDIRELAAAGPAQPPLTARERLDAAAVGRLPDTASSLSRAIDDAAADAPLVHLQTMVDRVRERERSATAAQAAEWRRARGLLHLALAGRRSRLALYDLRETIQAADAPLPGEYLAAAASIGDATCLEALAAAYARAIGARGPGRASWRQSLADTFRAVMARERVTRRHSVMKRIDQRWPGLINRLV